ncbi:MAG: hypothetical protein ACOY0S_01080 [Patescibacteria group bacterium]
MKKNLIITIIFIFLICFGLWLRFRGIIAGSFAFTYDTGRDLLAVRDLIYQKKISLLGPTTGQMGIFYGPWWYWFLTMPFLIFQGNPTDIAAFIGFLGVVAVALAWIWGSKYYDVYFGLSLAGILALAPFFVSVTSQIWSPDLLALGTLLVIILLARLPKLGKRGLVMFGFLLALLTEMEIVYGLIWGLAILIALFLWQRKILFSAKTLWLILGVTLVELPRFIFEIRHGFGQTKAFLMALGAWGSATFHFERLWLWLDNILVVAPGNSWFWRFSLAAAVAIILLLGWRHFPVKQKILVAQLLTIITVFGLVTLGYPKDFWHYYLFGLPVVSAVLVALVFSQMARFLSGKVALTLLGVYLLLLLKPGEFLGSLKNPSFVGDAAVYRNQLAVIDDIYRQAGGENFNYIAYTPPQIDYTWRYLFWWRSQTKYNFGPVIPRQGKYFVIIEPDPGYPQRIIDWLKVRENDGVLLGEKTFPSGIRLQLRRRTPEQNL